MERLAMHFSRNTERRRGGERRGNAQPCPTGVADPWSPSQGAPNRNQNAVKQGRYNKDGNAHHHHGEKDFAHQLTVDARGAED